MAVTEIHPITTTLNKALDYIMNPKKTDDKLLVDGFGCSPEIAFYQFNQVILKSLSPPSPLSPAGQSRQLYTALSVNDSNRGYPNIAVTTVTAVTRPLCKRNLPAVFFAAVLINDMVLI